MRFIQFTNFLCMLCSVCAYKDAEYGDLCSKFCSNHFYRGHKVIKYMLIFLLMFTFSIYFYGAPQGTLEKKKDKDELLRDLAKKKFSSVPCGAP